MINTWGTTSSTVPHLTWASGCAEADRTADEQIEMVLADLKVMRRALRNIVNVLGPDDLCDCRVDDPLCGLRDEAINALRTAQKALLDTDPYKETT